MKDEAEAIKTFKVNLEFDATGFESKLDALIAKIERLQSLLDVDEIKEALSASVTIDARS